MGSDELMLKHVTEGDYHIQQPVNHDLRIKVLNDLVSLPTREHLAAGVDVSFHNIRYHDDEYGTSQVPFTPNGIYDVSPGFTYKADTGLAFDFPDGWFGLIDSRSSLAVKYGMMPVCRTIDTDYRGELTIVFQLQRPARFQIGERIAQMILLPFSTHHITQVDELRDTKRGDGGFGSSGK